MDIILEFESKLKNIGGEKVYSAREIMKIFGYDKWERFYGAITRAKDELNDENKISQNFFYVVDKETGGRPKEDILLTLGACYLVLKKCDNRKENVTKMLQYLDEILTEERNKKNIENKNSWEKAYLIIFFVFLFFSFVYYLNTYFNYFNKNIDNTFVYNLEEINKKELVEKKKVEEEVFVKYDEKIEDFKVNNITDRKIQNNDFKLILDEYINKKGDTLNSFDKSFNYRSDFVKTLTGENLINAYFELGNNKIYRDSCSILSTKNCLSSSKSNLKSFSNFWEKTKEGYEILNIFKVDGYFGIDKNIYCVKYRYKLKYDKSDNYITEIFNYTTEVKNGYEQVNGRYCEKVEKGGRNLSCPFKLNTYYCK